MQSRVSHYQIIKEIGRGAMGRVYLAYDERIQRNVAIKELVLPQGVSEEEMGEAIERFKREARAAGRLSHPNILTIYSVEQEEGIPFIVMEYLEGTTLGLMLNQGPISDERAIGIISQVLDALSYAHNHEVIHRDIKPDNIFLLFDGRVKVADFGIARVASTSTMTQLGTIIGSPGYMSPEQVRGEKIDERTDIFAAGIILYEMLGGRNPFAAETATGIMYRIVHEDPQPLAELNPSIPPFIQAIIAKAVAKNREERYPDAALMKRDLQEARTPDRVGTETVILGSPAAPAAFLPSTSQDVSGTVLRTEDVAGMQIPLLATAKRKRFSTKALIAIAAAAVLLIAGGLISVFLFMSSSSVVVPDLTGVNISKAKDLLSQKGLLMESEEVSYPGFADGEVISQVPGAGQKVDKGAVVKVDANRVANGTNLDGTSQPESEQAYIGQMDQIIMELSGLNSQIVTTGTEINNSIDPTYYRMTRDMMPQCNSLLASLNGLKAKASAITPPEKFRPLHPQLNQLIDYCIGRVNAFVSGINAVQTGGNYQAAFQAGVGPKSAFDSQFPAFQNQYTSLKSG